MRNRVVTCAVLLVPLLAVATPASAAKAAGPACATADSPDGWSTGTVGTGPVGDFWWLTGSGLPKGKLIQRVVTDPNGAVSTFTGVSSVPGTIGDLEPPTTVAGTYAVVLQSPAGGTGKTTVYATCSYVAT